MGPFDDLIPAQNLRPSAPPMLGQQPLAGPPRQAPPVTPTQQAIDQERLRSLRDNNSAQEDTLDPGTVDMLAHQYVLSGQLPPLGMGRSATASRQAVLNRASQIAGVRPGESVQVGFARYRNGVHALQQQEAQLTAVRGNEQAALLNGQQYIDRSAELPGQTRFAPLNAISNFVQRRFGGTTIGQMDLAHDNFANETARVISTAPSGGGVLSDSARQQWMEVLNSNASIEQKRAALEQLRTDMDNRVRALDTNIQQGYRNLEGGTNVSGGADQQGPLPPGGYSADDVRAAVSAAHANGATGSPGGPATPPPMGGPPQPPSGPPPTMGGPGPERMTSAPRAEMPSGGDTTSIATGPLHSVPDPTLAGVNAHVEQMLQTGVPDDQIRAFVRSLPQAPGRDVSLSGVEAVLDFRRQHPEYRGSYNPSLENMMVPVSTARRLVTNFADSAYGAGTVGVGNAMTAGYLPELAPGNTELNRAGMNEIRNRHPIADIVGNTAGGAAMTLAPEAAAARYAPKLASAMAQFPRLSRALSTTAYGAAYGSGNSPNDRLGGAMAGAALAPLSEAGGAAVTSAAGRVIAPTGGALRPLYDAGVRPSIGQRFGQTGTVGRIVNTVEQAAQSIPGLGMLPARSRQLARDQFERGAFNNALREIGDQLPANMPLGRQPHAYMQQAFNKAYADARSGMTMTADPEFIQAYGQVRQQVQTLTPDAQRQFAAIVRNSVGRRYVNGVIPGRQFVAAQSEIGARIRSLRSSPTGDRELADALDDFSGALDDAAARNSPPQFVQALDQAHRGYAQAVRVEMAAAARGGGNTGRFTPTQYDAAVQRASGGIRSRQYLAGNAVGSDYAEAGRALTDTLPNSGSAERLMTGQAFVGGGMGGMAGLGMAEPTTLATTGLATLPYMPGIDRALKWAMSPASSNAVRTIRMGQLLRKYSNVGGALAAPFALQQGADSR